MRIVIRKVSGLWIVQCSDSNQIYFSHKNIMKCFQYKLNTKLVG